MTDIGIEDHRTLALWAADCADHVLAAFEDPRPDDDRPRRAIAAARAWARGELSVADVRAAAFAAHDAAREAEGRPAAVAAARAAAHAASTGHVAIHASHAADYARKAVEARRGPATMEKTWQRGRLPAHLRVLGFPS